MDFRRSAALAATLIIAALLVGANSSEAQALALTTGFTGDPVLTSDSAATRALWVPRAVGEGAGIVRVAVFWSDVAPVTRPQGFAPANPASTGYNWTPIDAAVRDLSSHGLTVLISISSAPTWAEGSDQPASATPGSWRPDPAQYASFAEAAALRYDGHP